MLEPVGKHGGVDMTIPVLVVDDHEIVCSGIAALLRGVPDIEVVGEAGDGRAAVAEAHKLNPAVVLMDIHMPGMNGIEAAWRILETLPDTKIIALSMYADLCHVDRMIDAGGTGYLLKNCTVGVLTDAIRCVAGGGMYLDERLGYLPPGRMQVSV